MDERAFNTHPDDDEEEEDGSGAGRGGEAWSENEENDPATPRAGKLDHAGDYFSNQLAPARPSTGPLTPKRSFLVRSRTDLGPTSSRPPDRDPSPGLAVAYPPRSRSRTDLPLTRDAPEALHAEVVLEPDTDLESLHGEQGSDWGEDEANFEWLDNENAPEAENGDGRPAKQTSPTKRIGGRIKQVVIRSNSVAHGPGGSESRKLRKNLVFPRRAPPPPPPDTPSAPPPPFLSPDLQNQPLPPRPGDLVFPTARINRPSVPTRGWTEGQMSASFGELSIPSHRERKESPRPLPSPLMVVPLRGDGPSSSGNDRLDARNSHMSMQSSAYSFYDLDSPGPSTPRATTPTAHAPGYVAPQQQSQNHGSLGVPRGRYAKVSISQLEREREARERSASEPGRRPSPDEELISPEGFVSKGIEARGQGDLPRSAWYFMRAAEGGNATGRMYWGECHVQTPCEHR